MRRILRLLALLPLGSAPAPFPKPDPTRDDLKAMQGEWVLAAYTKEGDSVARAPGRGWCIVIAGGRMTLYCGGTPYVYALTLKAEKAPRRFTYEVTGEGWPFGLYPRGGNAMEEVPRTTRGLYAVGGETLRFCHNGPGKELPAALAGPEAGAFVEVYKRLRR